MKTELQRLLEEAGYDCQSYSGRAMYGRTCLAVTLERGQPLGHLIADLLGVLDGDDTVDLASLAEQVRDMCTDQMGLGTVLYWPDLPYAEDDE